VATRRWKMLKICLFVLTEYINGTDRRTDRRTDIARRHRPRLCTASRGKNWQWCLRTLVELHDGCPSGVLNTSCPPGFTPQHVYSSCVSVLSRSFACSHAVRIMSLLMSYRRLRHIQPTTSWVPHISNSRTAYCRSPSVKN